MKIPSHEELQRMSDAQIAELNFYLTVKKTQRLSILAVVGGAVMYGLAHVLEQYFTNKEELIDENP